MNSRKISVYVVCLFFFLMSTANSEQTNISNATPDQIQDMLRLVKKYHLSKDLQSTVNSTIEQLNLYAKKGKDTSRSSVKTGESDVLFSNVPSAEEISRVLFGGDSASSSSQRTRSIRIQLTKGKLVAGPAKLRQKPQRDSPEVKTVQIGEVVTILESAGDWYRVVTDDDKIGYLFGDFIQLRKDEDKLNSLDSSSAEFAQSTSSTKEALTERNRGQTRGVVSPRAGATSKLGEAVGAMADAIEKERPVFQSSAFRCRQELETCRPRFGFLDCDLTMIVCLVSVLTGS